MNYKDLALLVILIILPLKISANFSCLDLNTASLEDLEKLTGVGPVIAQKIIDNRPFSSIDDLIKISGIGEVKLAAIKEQGLACVMSSSTNQTINQPTVQTKPIQNKSTKETEIKPKIILSFPKNSPANQEIPVTLTVSNFKNVTYDVKISLEANRVLSDIYNEKENKWQSSNYYLKECFLGPSWEKTFKLKINEKNLNFQGEADLLARVRENGKSSYLEQREKINIVSPLSVSQSSANFLTEDNLQLSPNRNLATINQSVTNLFYKPDVFLIALINAFVLSLLILVLKIKLKNY
ncbi:MAG: ComEA family DNA-binding protein [Minisyncoccales bacterium]